MANPQSQAGEIYNKKKHFAKGLIDVSLMVANAGRMDTLLQTTTRDVKFYVVLVLLIICVVLQLILAWMLWFDAMYGHVKIGPAPNQEDYRNDEEEFAKEAKRHIKKLKRKLLAEKLSNGSELVLLLILVLNIFITAFGAKVA
ncbi:ninjurin-2 isoform X1 [Lingula anatina]|uniref:Ninjurin-2 isoform X1 n=1 Tax=Lingula anatina TaxID=7574 RepID=A0A1S3HS55_LINAN|nr:ninjurin-2 isoform X1 [Lingula anatina]|eukprot:XP_013388867.1 ninjurin-2 isoform X1 [Lingula anatina]